MEQKLINVTVPKELQSDEFMGGEATEENNG